MTTLICIDIDGTLTANRTLLADEVIAYLQELVAKGHKLLFVTGRTLFWSLHLLEQLPFSYYLGVLNGALLISMPTKRTLVEHTLSHNLVEEVLSRLAPYDVGVVWFDTQDKSYFYDVNASPVVVQHLEARRHALKENWEVVKTCPKGTFHAIRLFCLPHTAKTLSYIIENEYKVHAPMMTDSYDPCFSVVQITNLKASKGSALQAVAKELGTSVKIIACGDDYNDISMLKQADYAVVMNTAPAEVLQLADIIAPAAKENGIITGLQQALTKL